MVVRKDGLPARRWRVLWRQTLAWLPVLALPVCAKVWQPALGLNVAALAAAALLAALTLIFADHASTSADDMFDPFA